MSTMPMQQLLLLLVGVPPTPSSLRVRVWRRLRSLGAVPLKRSAYLLPDTPERYEDFQWLAQEIEREGGEATLIRIQQIENISPENVQRLLHEPRDHDYRQLAARYRKVLQSLEKKPAVKGARLPEELAHLAREHQRIRDIDYFDAPSGAEVRRLEEVIAMRTRRQEPVHREERRPLDLAGLRGRRWVTRPRPHIDRIASAWLIKRFIDPDAEFLFAPPAEFPRTRSPSMRPAWSSAIRARIVRSRRSSSGPACATAAWPGSPRSFTKPTCGTGNIRTRRRAASTSPSVRCSPRRPTTGRSSRRA